MSKVKAQTILKRVQKGISSGVQKFTSGFSSGDRIPMFRKRQIIKPYLHPYDSERIEDTIKNRLRSDAECKKDPQFNTNINKFLPQHLVDDIYSLYYNKPDHLQLEPLDKTNSTKYKIIESINNSMIKIMTNNSHIGSYVFSEEICKFLYKRFMQLPPEQQQDLIDKLNNTNQQGKEEKKKSKGSSSQSQSNSGKDSQESNEQDQSEGSGDGKMGKNNKPSELNDHQNGSGSVDSNPNANNIDKTGSSAQGMANNSYGNNSKKDISQNAIDQMIDNLLNNTQGKKEFDQALKNAEQKIEKLKDAGVDFDNSEELPEEEQIEIIQNLNNLDSLRGMYKSLQSSKDKVLKAIEKMLNNTDNYFSKKCITNDVDLFECEEILNINGMELLHPIFKKSRIFDLSITERKYIGKVDLYVDCSGSMSSGCGGDLSTVSRIDLAKSLALQMKEMGILGDLYEFEDRPKKIKTSDISILMMAARGGTNIETVLKQIIKSNNNAVVLTDGESHVESYTHKAFFIGVGTDFSYFANGGSWYGSSSKNSSKELTCGQKLVENNQCLLYNGTNFVLKSPNR